MVVVAVLLLGPTRAQATIILQYKFNQTGTNAIGTGNTAVNLPMTRWDGVTWNSADNHAADGSGVSGLPEDRAYFDPSTVLDPVETAGTSNSHYYGGFAGNVSIPEVQALTALTVQGWFKTAAGKPIGTDGTASALVGNLGNSSNDGGWVVRGQNTANAGRLELRFGELMSSLDHVTVASNAAAYSETNEWVFFAVTLNASDGAWQFFKGTTSSAVAGAGSGATGALNGGALTTSNRNFYISNSNSESSKWSQGRAFPGSLDNIRVFNTVLSQSEMEGWRQLDLLNIPEPATFALCLVISAALLPRIRRRREARRCGS